MRISFLVLLNLISYCLFGQGLTVSGVVQDRISLEPLPYATVGVKGESISTITNLQGEFDFHLPDDYRNEILTISMLGYTNFEAPVWSLIPSSQKILMDKSPTLLDEVTVTDSLTGGDIFRIAWSRIEKNFPSQPFMLEGFYRDVKKVGGTYISLLEAAVKIFDDNYDEPRNKLKLRERVRLIEVRQSLGYENKFTTYFDQDNLLEDLLLRNTVRYRQLDPATLYHQFAREKDSYYNGHRIYVISIDKPYSLRMFIDKHDYSITHIEYETGATGEVLEKRKGLVSKFAGIKKSIDFRQFEGRMYLNFMTMTSKINWYDGKTDELKFETELYQQLLINEIHPNFSEKITTTDKMRNYGLQYQDLPYNKQFWENYNVIKETPLDKKILTDLEKLAPLDKQFEN